MTRPLGFTTTPSGRILVRSLLDLSVLHTFCRCGLSLRNSSSSTLASPSNDFSVLPLLKQQLAQPPAKACAAASCVVEALKGEGVEGMA